jgi:hypothetical protein
MNETQEHILCIISILIGCIILAILMGWPATCVMK